jgi:hypothetical protein
MRLGPFIDLAREDRGKFVSESFQSRRLFSHLRRELIVENGRWYGSDQPDCGGEQRLGDTRRDYGE